MVESGGDLSFSLNDDTDLQGFDALGGREAGSYHLARLSVGHCEGLNWYNLRIVLENNQSTPLSIVHAKSASVTKNIELGLLTLNLHLVDIERLSLSEHSSSSGNFISFDRWKHPLHISLHPQNSPSISAKKLPVYQWKQAFSLDQKGLPPEAWKHLNKSLAIGLSPFSLSLLIVPFGISRGSRDRSGNLFWGVLICICFYLLSFLSSSLLGADGMGWWVPNFMIVLMCLCFALRKRVQLM